MSWIGTAGSDRSFGSLVHGCGSPATVVLGQPDFGANGENHWNAVTAETLCWPYGICLHGSTLAIADSGNNRVMLWDLSDLLRGESETLEEGNLICV